LPQRLIINSLPIQTKLVNRLKKIIIRIMPAEITRKIHARLIKSSQTVAVAESCTGGGLSSLLTSLPGSSNYFLLGLVTYSNKAKTKLLNIPDRTIKKYGAVSRQVAMLMASGVRKKINADFGLSITGIAGPSGGTPAKPVGTVYICLSKKDGNICRKFNFRGSRREIRKGSTQKALQLLCAHLPR